MKGIEEAFSQTSAILLGKRLIGIRDYENWLWEGIRGRVEARKSKLSGKLVYVASMDFFLKMGSNVVTLDEALELGKQKIQISALEGINLKTAISSVKSISLSTPEIVYDKNVGTEESACYGPTQDCYRVTFTWFSKAIAYSFWARTSEYCFGCSQVVDCKYCMRCFSSTKLVRCFEMSDCNACSDCLFCHNCENVENGMFCFNSKGLRYAIANVEYPKEEYLAIKKKILLMLSEKLEKEKKLKTSIFNIGSKK